MLFRSDRKSTRLNSSHLVISYAVFCLKKKKKTHQPKQHTTRQSQHAPSTTARYRRLRCSSAVAKWYCSVLPLVVFLRCFFFFFFFRNPRRSLSFPLLPLPALF